MNKLLKGLNKNQKLAVQHKDGACCVIASAGSGKTQVLIKRVQYLIEQGVNPRKILTFTFTKKASEEMKSRLANDIGRIANNVTIGTFHSVYYSILRDYQSLDGGVRLDLATDWWKEKLIKDIMNSIPKANSMSINEKDMLNIIAMQKNNMISYDQELLLPSGLMFLEPIIRKIYAQYEISKERENKIDFEDMVFKCYQIFKKDITFLQSCRERYDYILVDEFQDSNRLQEAMLDMLVNDGKNIFVVGDPRQSIYKFMSADVDIIFNFQKKWKAKLIELNINYRCSENIVEASNRLISHNKKMLGGDAIANKPKSLDPIHIQSHNEFEEAKDIVKEIVDILDLKQYKEKDITILYRTNGQSKPFEQELIENNVPYAIIGGLTFYDRREIKDIISYLELAKDSTNDSAMKEIINRPNRFLGKVFIQNMEQYASDNQCSMFDALVESSICEQFRYKSSVNNLIMIIETLQTMYKNDVDLIKIIKGIITLTNYEGYLEKQYDVATFSDKMDNIETLFSFARKFKLLDNFLNNVYMAKDKLKQNEGKEKVKLMSIHKSKGLEFPIVFVAGLSDGQLPFSRDHFETDIEEERRLFYVAMTRAEDILYISGIDSYRDKSLMDSQFIEEMIKRSGEDESTFKVSSCELDYNTI